MENIGMILESNLRKSTNLGFRTDGFHFQHFKKEFNGETIKDIIEFANGIKSKYKNSQLPIHLDLGEVEIIDKLSYVMLECLCYLLIEEYKYKIHLNWKPLNRIHTFGVYSSPLLMLNKRNFSKQEEFINKFRNDTYRNHYRKVVDQKKKNFSGIIMSDINTFLTVNHISEENREQLSEVVAELVGNAGEHGKSECLVDIDVSEPFKKKAEGVNLDEDYIGINIAIVNFSSKNLNEDLKMKIKKDINNTRYDQLKKAYEYHKNHFTDDYIEEDFWNLACLQHKISGSLEKISSGGTGSTVLITSLQEKSDKYRCYLISGKRSVFFFKEDLEFDHEDSKWLGFNKNSDFFSNVPDPDVNTPCYINFPGTAYNLTFIMKEEELK